MSRNFQEFRTALVAAGFSDNRAMEIANEMSKGWLFYATSAEMAAEARRLMLEDSADYWAV